MPAVFIRGGLTHRGSQVRRPCKDGSRDSNHGISRVAKSYQRVGTDMEELLPVASEGA